MVTRYQKRISGPLMDRIDTVNDSPEMFLRNDTPGCIRHDKGDTFSEVYLSYLGDSAGLLGAYLVRGLGGRFMLPGWFKGLCAVVLLARH